MKKLILLTLILKLGSAMAQTPPPKYTYELLQDTRGRQVIPTYTKEERATVIGQAKIVLGDIFIHRELKIEHFGADVDPVPMLNKIEAELDQIKDDTEFHTKMMNVFFRQKDLHTTYQFPMPYACYTSFVPFSLKEVIDTKGQKVIAVSTLVDKEEVLKVLPAPMSIRVGDVLVSYNGFPVEDFIKSFELRSMGANPEAVRRRSVNLLTLISHKLSFIPTKNNVDLTFKNRQGKLYSTTVPWVSRINQDCLNPPPSEIMLFMRRADGQLETGASEYQNDYNVVYRSRKFLKDSELKDSAEPILKYKTIDNEWGRFGYLKLESFVPEKLSVEALVAEMKNLLLNQLSGTDGIIFDLRSNGGGYIALVENMVQLFSSNDITPMNFKIKASQANLFQLSMNMPSNPFTLAVKEAIALGEPYGRLLPLDSTQLSSFSMASVGQYFFKPVALLTDASCYSSCDMFSAQMQDHAAALIFGEDSTTGAGGANNTNLTGLLQFIPPANWGIFKKMPAKQELGFAYRQTVRVGARSGVLIEDTGVQSDQIVETKLSDLYTNSGDQLRTISQKLNEQAALFTSSAKLKEGKTDSVATAAPSVFAKWEGTEQVQIRQDGKILATVDVEDSNPQGRLIELPKDIALKYFPDNFELLGLKNQKRVWRKVHSIRLIPEPVVIAPAQALVYDFSNDAPFTSLSAKGWNIRDGALHLGPAPQYESNLRAETSLFVVLPDAAYTLTFDSTVLSEAKFDFFKASIIVDDKEKVIIEPQSGRLPLQANTVDLKEYAGKRIELRFLFTSDAATNDEGPIIDNLKFTPQSI